MEPTEKAMNLPKGYKKMELELMMSPKHLLIFEKHILRMLLRDYHVFYSKKFYDIYYKIYLYCNPSQESSLTYRIGCYNQTMFNYNKKKDITNSDHKIPKDYLESYLIPFEETDYEN